jgi:hypothetical protein
VTQDHPFELPQLHELTAMNVEQGRAAFTRFMEVTEKAWGLWFGAMPANEMTFGCKVAHARGVQFAKQNVYAGFVLASELAGARDLQEVFAIQSRYTQAQMRTYTLQAQELGRLMMDTGQSARPRT